MSDSTRTRSLYLGLALVCAASCSQSTRLERPFAPPRLPAGTVRIFTQGEAHPAPKEESPKKGPLTNSVSLDALTIELGGGTADRHDAAHPVVRAVSLSTDEAGALFRSLPPLEAPPAAKAFAWRDGPAPPKVTATRAIEDAAPGAPPPAVQRGPLTVKRHSPEGKVAKIDTINIRFSQPMFALGAVLERDIGDAVVITPPVEGQWQWVDPAGLRFVAKPGFARATTYRVEVSTRLAAHTGATLAKPHQFTFHTQPPQLESYTPTRGPTARKPVIRLRFDIGVDTTQALQRIELVAKGGDAPIPLRLADAKAFDEDPSVSFEAPDPTRVAVVPVRALKKDTEYVVTVRDGVVPMAGNLPTESKQTFGFRVHGALTLTASRCGRDCRSTDSIDFEFSNPLANTKKIEETVRIKPTPERGWVRVSDKRIAIYGRKKARSRYQVQIPGPLFDVYGQKLTRSIRKSFRTGTDRYYGAPLIAEQFVVIPATEPSIYAFLTRGVERLNVRLYAVKAEDHRAYRGYAAHFFEQYEAYSYYAPGFDSLARTEVPPGKLIRSRVLKPKKDGYTMHGIDLSKALKNGFGHAMIVIEADAPRKNETKPAGTVVWVQKTNIGLTTMTDAHSTYALATHLSTGEPIEAVHVSPIESDAAAVTDAQGVATLSADGVPPAHLLVARVGDDVALAPWNGGRLWKNTPRKGLIWYVADDRKLYRPGERVHLKGWVRQYTNADGGRIQSADLAGEKITWLAKDARGEEIAKGEVEVVGNGGFSLDFETPTTPNLGYGRIDFAFAKKGRTGSKHTSRFRIEEFRRPEFEVNVSGDPGPHLLGAKARFEVTAKYYSGGALSAAPVQWVLETRDAFFTPPNRSAYFFGQQQPWWRHHRREPSRTRHVVEDTTDADGRAALPVGLREIAHGGPVRLLAEATVSDVNRQAWTARDEIVVHPARLMVGMRTKARYFKAGEHIALDTIVTDLEGKLVAGRTVTVDIMPHERSTPGDPAAQPFRCTLTSGLAPQPCHAPVRPSGLYEIVAKVVDDKERTHRSRKYVWVAGASFPGGGVAKGVVEISTEGDALHEGDELKVMMRIPFAPARVMLTLLGEGIIEKRTLHLTSTSQVVSVALSERHSPGFHFNVRAVGAGKFAAGSRYLKVYPDAKVVDLSVAADRTVAVPGSEVMVQAKATDGTSPLAGAEIAFIVVDESVLALADYRIPNPIDVFYPYRGDGSRPDELRGFVKLPPSPKEMEAMESAAEETPVVKDRRCKKRMRRDRTGSGGHQVKVRKNFAALALFAPRATTGPDGVARVKMTLPDSLTRYRITALAAAGPDRFGQAESTITARMPLMVRPSPPRFANYGDAFELPVSVQNVTDAPVSAQIALRASNLAITDTAGWRIEVPAHDRIEVRFPIKTVAPGQGRGELVVTSGALTDAAEFSFPVWSPLSKHAEAVYGHLDEGAAAYPLKLPPNIVPGFGGVRLDTSATVLETLSDAYVYLRTYPHSCSEQIASRLLATSALGALLERLNVDAQVDPASRRAALRSDIKTVSGRQKNDGGFGLWPASRAAHPFASVHVMHALVRAREAKLEIQDHILQRGARYLERIQKQIPEHYSDNARHLIASYAIFVLSKLPDRKVDGLAKALAAKLRWDEEDPATFGWLLASLRKDPSPLKSRLLRHLSNHIDETASSAHVGRVHGTDGHWHMHSERRADAVVLAALIGADPKSDLNPKLMRGLMDRRIKGRWRNTQENLFVLTAGLDYFKAYEAVEPDFTARMWLGAHFVGSAVYQGHSTRVEALEVPVARVGSETQRVSIAKEGAGRLYYRVGVTYAKADLRQPAIDRGFTVSRAYEAIEEGDVTRDPNGDWRVRAGALVRVRVTMKVPGQRYYVALVDPLPAGFEAQNPELATTAQAPVDEGQNGSRRYWVVHDNLRDERVEAYGNALRGGRYEYTYIARATTPGTFIAGGTLVEEMYHPETYGRGATELVHIAP